MDEGDFGHLDRLPGYRRVQGYASLNFGVMPIEVKEIVYQAAAYLGIGRVFPVLHAANKVLTARRVKLPLEGQAIALDIRLEAGNQTQVDIDEGMRGFQNSGPEENRHFNKWLAGN